MDSPTTTPTPSPQGKRQRTSKAEDSSPQAPSIRERDDPIGPADASPTPQSLRSDDGLLQFSTVDTTQASELTPVGVKTSPELVAAVQSFDSLLASQNETLGSLMHSPSGVGSPASADDDDDLELELERLARDNELFRQELNILAAAPERRRQPAPPLHGIPESPLRISRPTTPQQTPQQSGFREEVKLELSESPIPPGGSNVNTPDLASAIRTRPIPAEGDEQKPIQTVMDDDHHDLPELPGTYNPQNAIATHSAPITPTPQTVATSAAVAYTSTTNNSSTSSSSRTAGSSGRGSTESSTTVVFDESGNKTTSSSSSSGEKVPPSSSSSSSSATSIRLELSAETPTHPFGSRSPTASPLRDRALAPVAEGTPVTGDPSFSPHAKSLATGELIPHPKRSPAEDETKGSTPPDEVAARDEDKGRPKESNQSPASAGSPRTQSPGKLRIKSLATGALVQSPSKRHSPSQHLPKDTRSDLPHAAPIVGSHVEDPVKIIQSSMPTAGKSPQRHLPKARNLFPSWTTSSEETVLKTKSEGGTTADQSTPSFDEAQHQPITPVTVGLTCVTAEAPADGTSPGKRTTHDALAPHIPPPVTFSASTATTKTLVTGAFVSRVPSTHPPQPPLPPVAAPETQQDRLGDGRTTFSVPAPPLVVPSPPSSLSPDAFRVGTAFGFLGHPEEDEGDDDLDDGDSDARQAASSAVLPPLLNQRPPPQTRQPSVGDSEVSSSPPPRSLLDGARGQTSAQELLSTTATTAGLTPSATWDSLADQAVAVEQSQGDGDSERLLQQPPSPGGTLETKKGKKGKILSPTAALPFGDSAAVADKVPDEHGSGKQEPNTNAQNRRKLCHCLRSGWTCLMVSVLIISLVVLISTSVVLIRQRDESSSNTDVSPSMAPSQRPNLFRTHAPSLAPSQALSNSSSMQPNHTETSEPPTYSPATTTPTVSQDLFDYLISISPDGGAALNNKTSPQHQAFMWLASNEGLARYSPMRLRQRYTLATFYYSTNGDQWDVRTNWLTNENECNWFSRAIPQTVCGPNGEFQRLELSYNNLDGVIPPELSLLSDTLQNMSLSGGPTRYLTGTIPTYMGQLSNLYNFRLWNNQLSGTIISEIGNLSKLRYLDVSLNRLTGSLATEVGQLRNLTWLDCANNRLSGQLPVQLGQASNLKFLDLSFNGFGGPIPTSLGNLSALTTLNLDSNRLERIHSNVGMMLSLESLSLANNALGGTIPDSIGRLTRLQNLNVSHNLLSGAMPSTMGRLRQLTDGLDVSFNRLTGTLPQWVGALDGSLRTVLLNHNSFRGTVPDSLALLTSVTLLRLDSNLLTGAVPPAVCQVFDVTRPSFFADCGELDCHCCNYCCTESGCTCRFIGTADEWRCFF